MTALLFFAPLRKGFLTILLLNLQRVFSLTFEDLGKRLMLSVFFFTEEMDEVRIACQGI